MLSWNMNTNIAKGIGFGILEYRYSTTGVLVDCTRGLLLECVHVYRYRYRYGHWYSNVGTDIDIDLDFGTEWYRTR